MKPTVSTKQQRLDSSVKAPVSKRRKANKQPRETDSATDEHFYVIEDSPSVIADTCRRTASLKRSRNSMPTATKSQEPTVEGITFPPNFQESLSKTSTIAETARLHAEIEELKRSVQALLASNKNLREEQAVKTQKIVDSDGSRAHRFATTNCYTKRATKKRGVERDAYRDTKPKCTAGRTTNNGT